MLAKSWALCRVRFLAALLSFPIGNAQIIPGEWALAFGIVEIMMNEISFIIIIS
jgi:hypothetical protein